MNYKEATDRIKKYEKKLLALAKKGNGYLVSFEVRDRSILRSDHFPDVHNGEAPISNELDAWNLAERFANSSGPEVVNVYVIRSKDFSPVLGYDVKMIRRY